MRNFGPLGGLLALALAACAVCAEEEPPGPLTVRDGRPVLAAGGRTLATAYSETFPWDGKFHRRNEQFARAGTDLFLLLVRGGFDDDFHTSYFWRGDDVYGDETGRDDRQKDITLEKQAEAILAANPQAHFLVRWGNNPPKAWRERFPGEMQTLASGKKLDEASWGSDRFLDGVCRYHEQVVRYCEGRPWGARVLGYMLFLPGEGLTLQSIEGELFDQSAALQAAFAAWVRETYADDAARRAAWNDPQASRDAVKLPTMDEWRAARAGWLHWPKPEQTRRYRDFFTLLRKLHHRSLERQLHAIRAAARRPVAVGVDALKQPMLGWLIQDAFSARGLGMDFPSLHLGSGAIGVGGLLDGRTLDALITPADYSARSVGFGFESEGLNDSLVLRGKTILIEDDARSWATDERITQGAWRNESEARAGLLRNFGAAASRGLFPYWMNVGKGYFDEPRVQAVVAEQIPLRQAALKRPLRPTEHAIALILDDESPLEEDFTSGFQHLAVLRQRVDELARTGLPYRVHLFSDLARADFPRFRAYLFPNLFRLDAQRIALLREKVLRDGCVAIFGPGTGLTDGTIRSAEGAKELLGLPLELHERATARRVMLRPGAHPALRGIEDSIVFGDSYPYGPLLAPAYGETAEYAELGKLAADWKSNVSGLALKEFGAGAAGSGKPGPRGPGDAAVVFCAAAPIPAALLRALALYGGCAPWSDLGDVVAASEDMLCVHTLRAGKRTLHLPRACDVKDLSTGAPVAAGATAFEADFAAPDTRIFLLEPVAKP